MTDIIEVSRELSAPASTRHWARDIKYERGSLFAELPVYCFPPFYTICVYKVLCYKYIRLYIRYPYSKALVGLKTLMNGMQ